MSGRRYVGAVVCAMGSLLVFGPSQNAQAQEALANFGFEFGDFSGFDTLGNTSIQDVFFGEPPTEGDFQAVLTTDTLFGGNGTADIATLESFLGLTDNALSETGATTGSAISFGLNVEAGSQISFDFNFLTNETTPDTFNDAAFFTVSGQPVNLLADTESTFEPSFTTFDEQTGFSTFEFTFTEAGVFDVGFVVIDDEDTVVASGLAIDNIVIGPVVPISPFDNNGFELGDFTGFETLGDASIVSADFGVSPPEGVFQALLMTGDGDGPDLANLVAEVEEFLGVSEGELGPDGADGTDGTTGSALTLEVFAEEGDTLSFDFRFLTDEDTPDTFNDFAVFTVNGEVIEFLADTNAEFFEDSPTIFDEQTLEETFSFAFDSTGVFTIGIAVLNEGDTVVPSGLLLDNFVTTATVVPEPGTVALLAGLLGLASRRRKALICYQPDQALPL